MKFNRIRAVVKIHGRAKFHQAKCNERLMSYQRNRETDKKPRTMLKTILSSLRQTVIKILRGHVRTVPGNMRVKYEVFSFNRFGAISIYRPNWSDWPIRCAQTHTHIRWKQYLRHSLGSLGGCKNICQCFAFYFAWNQAVLKTFCSPYHFFCVYWLRIIANKRIKTTHIV